MPSSIFFLNLLQLKICAFDKDQRLSKLEAVDGKHVTLRCPKHPELQGLLLIGDVSACGHSLMSVT